MEDPTQNNEQEQAAPNSLEQLSFNNSSLSKLAYILPILLILTIVTIIYHHSWKAIGLGTLGYIVSLVLLMRFVDRFDHFVPRLFLFFLAVSPFGYAISISNYSQEIIYGSGGLYALFKACFGPSCFHLELSSCHNYTRHVLPSICFPYQDLPEFMLCFWGCAVFSRFSLHCGSRTEFCIMVSLGRFVARGELQIRQSM